VDSIFAGECEGLGRANSIQDGMQHCEKQYCPRMELASLGWGAALPGLSRLRWSVLLREAWRSLFSFES
jgi:hypothetical protein